MCKSVNKKLGILRRFVIWLAWVILRPSKEECETCDRNDACIYFQALKRGK